MKASKICLLLYAAACPGQDPTAMPCVLAAESHLLYFERMLLMHGPEGIGPMDFSIGREDPHFEKVRGQKNAELVGYEVSVWFLPAKKPPKQVRKTVGTLSRHKAVLLWDRNMLAALVHGVEATPGSAWRLTELVTQSRGPEDGWLIQELQFTRFDAGAPIRAEGALAHEALAIVNAKFDAATSMGIDCRVTSVMLMPVGTRGERQQVLSIDFEVCGLRFRSGQARIAKSFRGVCLDPDSPFERVWGGRSEVLLSDPETAGAAYQLCLGLRDPRLDPVGKR
jgi:hypothetical protein